MPEQGSLVGMSVCLQLHAPWGGISSKYLCHQDCWPLTWNTLEGSQPSAYSVGWAQRGAVLPDARTGLTSSSLPDLVTPYRAGRSRCWGEGILGNKREYVAESGLNLHLLNEVQKAESLDTREQVWHTSESEGAGHLVWQVLPRGRRRYSNISLGLYCQTAPYTSLGSWPCEVKVNYSHGWLLWLTGKTHAQ